ncbi:MAG: glycosyltransferase family 39 protein [Candidatus Dormibacteria bacterium]
MPDALRAHRRHVAGVLIVVLAFVALELVWVAAVPVGHPSDEYSHLGYVARIAHQHQLPGAMQPEKQQPPLYYLFGAVVEIAGGGFRAVRLVSVALGALTLAAVAGVAALVLPRRPWAPLLAAALVALLPNVEAVSAAVSDDSLANLSGALLLLISLGVLRRRPPGRRLLALTGLAIGVALLSKETDWPLVVLPLAAVLWASAPARRLANLAGVALLAGAVAGWWFIRNLLAFHALTPPLGPLTTGTNVRLRSLGQVRGALSLTLRSLLGPTGATGGVLPRSAAATGLMVALGAGIVAGLLIAVLRLRRRWPGLPPPDRAVVAVLGVAALLALLASVANSVLITLEPQARYLLVAVAAPAVALAAVAGDAAGGRRRLAGRGIAATVGVALLVLALDSLRVAAVQP